MDPLLLIGSIKHRLYDPITHTHTCTDKGQLHVFISKEKLDVFFSIAGFIKIRQDTTYPINVVSYLILPVLIKCKIQVKSTYLPPNIGYEFQILKNSALSKIEGSMSIIALLSITTCSFHQW